MVSCPHLTIVDSASARCAVLAAHAGIVAFAGPDRPNHPCDQCHVEWDSHTGGEPPTRDRLTPTMLTLMRLAHRISIDDVAGEISGPDGDCGGCGRG